MSQQQPPPFPHQPGTPQGPQQQQPYQQQQQNFPPQQQNFPPQGQAPQRRSNLAMIIGAIVLALALLVGGGYLLVTKVFGGDPGQDPGGPTNTGAGQGELPEQPTLEVPPVVTEVGKAAGLTCHDEATTTLKVKGCYLIEKGHLITLRYKIADDGSIAKVIITVLHNDVDPAKRAEEVSTIIGPVLDELPISDADRSAIDRALAGDNDNVSEDTEWSSEAGGTYNYRFSKDTTTLSVGEKSTEFVPRAPLTENHQPVFDELAARGWQCEADDISIECTDGKAGKIVAFLTKAGQPNNEARLVEFTVWFNGQQPVADEPRMTDAYEALAKAAPKGEVLAIGLRMLAEGEKQFFHSDVEFYRGDSYYKVRSVHFV